MDIEILNKLSHKTREMIIEREARLREIEEEKQAIALMTSYLENTDSR